VEQDEHFEVPRLWHDSEGRKEFKVLQIQQIKAVEHGSRSILRILGIVLGS